MANNHKPAEKPGLMLHYFHAFFWVTLVLAGIVTAALSVWSLQLTPFAEIVLLAVWLVAPVPLAIRARQRDANRQSDPNAVEHLLSGLWHDLQARSVLACQRINHGQGNRGEKIFSNQLPQRVTWVADRVVVSDRRQASMLYGDNTISPFDFECNWRLKVAPPMKSYVDHRACWVLQSKPCYELQQTARICFFLLACWSPRVLIVLSP